MSTSVQTSRLADTVGNCEFPLGMKEVSVYLFTLFQATGDRLKSLVLRVAEQLFTGPYLIS